jgi:hypothetical protein
MTYSLDQHSVGAAWRRGGCLVGCESTDMGLKMGMPKDRELVAIGRAAYENAYPTE